MLSNPQNSWHVRQQHKVRKWKPERASLREHTYPVRNRILGAHQLRRLMHLLSDNPAVMSCGDMISSPPRSAHHCGLPYRLRRWQRRLQR